MNRLSIVFGLLFAGSSAARAVTEICQPTGEGMLSCTIERPSDCDAIRDYPYARNLFCPAAFSAAQTMVSVLADSLAAKDSAQGVFRYYQTLADPQALPDDQAQTAIACLDTVAPWGGHRVVGAGTPLCHLIAYVTSLGPTANGKGHSENPVPDNLRAFPQYFSSLYPPRAASLLDEFRVGSAFDRIVRNLGSAGRDGFLEDYPLFSPDEIYDPDHWQRDPHYSGISGGGGGGWGGEITIVRSGTDPLVVLAFGGGGGGGMTSMRAFGETSSVLGTGGGGGMQFANGYRFRNQSYNGLGLGAGAGSDEETVQYSYSDYEGSGRPPSPIHTYNPAIVADYQQQLGNLTRQLRTAIAAGRSVVLRGGGGVGAGAEYLMRNGEEFTPHALSTQAGFQFSYAFQRRHPGPPPPTTGLDGDLEHAYELLGEFYRTATAAAYEECGRDYANFSCMCPKTQAAVVCMMGRELGDPAKVPAWLQEQHCPSAPALLSQPMNGLTSYQQFLLANANEPPIAGGTIQGEPPLCSDVLRRYFETLNTHSDASVPPRSGRVG